MFCHYAHQSTGVNEKIIFGFYNSFQDRRNARSRTGSLEIDSTKEFSGPADSENKAGDKESHVSEIHG